MMKYTFISILILLISGCSLLSPQRPIELNQYTLAPKLNIKKVRRTSKTILVATPTTGPSLQTNKIVYSEKPWQIKYFSNNQWVGMPTQLLLPTIVTALSKSHYYRAVVPAPFSGLTDYRLDTELVNFERDFVDNQYHSYVNLLIRAQLINVNTNRIIASQDFFAHQRVNGTTPYAGITASNQALAKVLQQLIPFCIRYS